MSGVTEQIEGLTDAVAKLTLKVAENERRIAELESERPDIDDVAKRLAELVYTGPGGRKLVEVTSGPVIDRIPFDRDDVIERAKRDLEDVKKPWNTGFAYVYKRSVVDAEFVVNREKRTVVVRLRWRYNGEILSRGIARCAPDECFNVHIGKVISLRRALGLEVPVEYVKAPAPKSVRVGDIVSWRYGAETCYSYEVRRVDGVNYDLLSLDSGDLYENHSYTADIIVPKIINDSREGTEVAE